MGLGLALGAFLKCLFNRRFAADVQTLAREGALSSVEEAPDASTPKTETIQEPLKESMGEKQFLAIQMLSELQREGRFIDFLEEDLSEYEDDEIGSSVRSIHEGCKKVLNQCVQKEKILDQEEESQVRINSDYNAHEVKLSGRVSDKFPLKGVLVHPGWKVTSFELPQRSSGAKNVVAPAEVEIG